MSAGEEFLTNAAGERLPNSGDAGDPAASSTAEPQGLSEEYPSERREALDDAGLEDTQLDGLRTDAAGLAAQQTTALHCQCRAAAAIDDEHGPPDGHIGMRVVPCEKAAPSSCKLPVPIVWHFPPAERQPGQETADELAAAEAADAARQAAALETATGGSDSDGQDAMIDALAAAEDAYHAAHPEVGILTSTHSAKPPPGRDARCSSRTAMGRSP